MNKELEKLNKWLYANKLTLNLTKSNFILFNVRNVHTNSIFDIKYIVPRSKRLTIINFLESSLIRKVIPVANKYTQLSIYNALIVSHLYYCAHIWGNTLSSLTDYINRLQKRILKLSQVHRIMYF